VYHVELRRFPHSARAFNLEERELVTRVLAPWLRGEEFEFGERRWNPRRADLQILEGDRLRPDELSMGRGWQNALRSATDVTARLLEVGVGVPEAAAGTPSALDAFGVAVLEAAQDGPLTFRAVVSLANQQFVGSRVSERLAVCEQTVWRLLHQGRLGLATRHGAVDRARWEGLVLDWETWTAEPATVWLGSAGQNPSP
jgi:hypothetical protein